MAFIKIISLACSSDYTIVQLKSQLLCFETEQYLAHVVDTNCSSPQVSCRIRLRCRLSFNEKNCEIIRALFDQVFD